MIQFSILINGAQGDKSYDRVSYDGRKLNLHKRDDKIVTYIVNDPNSLRIKDNTIKYDNSSIDINTNSKKTLQDEIMDLIILCTD